MWIAPCTTEEIVAICSQAAGPRVCERAIHALLETCRLVYKYSSHLEEAVAVVYICCTQYNV